MKKTMYLAALMTFMLPSLIRADQNVQREMTKDVVLRALVDELQRGKVGLKLEDLERPYFIEYALLDSTSANVTASLGAVTGKSENRSRRLRTDVRVGSYELDNTNFQGDRGRFGFGGMFGFFGGAAIPIENDYAAIRQGIWWATDRQYKSVIEDFENKKAFMQTKMIEDKPDDFSKEDVTVDFEDRIDAATNTDQIEELAVALSKIFREFSDIQRSNVQIFARGGNKYLVNTEGTRQRLSGTQYSLTVNATIQADDGMRFSDSIALHARKFDELPSLAELTERCKDMIGGLVAARDAPKLESYTGPVLFEAEAAATLFSRNFANRFVGGQRPIGGQRMPGDFEEMLDKRILPRFMNVVDDPTRETIEGTAVMGHYKYDDQGVQARAVTLVENGRLKALLMSRNPSKKFKNSTGHGRGSYQVRSSVGCLIVSAEDADDDKALKQKLIEACQDEDLEYGIRIASLGRSGGDRFSRFPSMIGNLSAFFPNFGGRGRGTMPLAMYKVYPDGREQRVRGVEIARIGQKAFKRILAAGEKPYVLNTGSGSGGQTVVAPAMLFEELDLAKVDRDFDKPPILPSPLARGG